MIRSLRFAGVTFLLWVVAVSACRGAKNPLLGNWNLVESHLTTGAPCYYDRFEFTLTTVNQLSHGKTGGLVPVSYNTEDSKRIWVMTKGAFTGSPVYYDILPNNRISVLTPYGPCVYQKAE